MQEIMQIIFSGTNKKFIIYHDSSMGEGPIRMCAFCYKAFKNNVLMAQNMELDKLVNVIIKINTEEQIEKKLMDDYIHEQEKIKFGEK